MAQTITLNQLICSIADNLIEVSADLSQITTQLSAEDAQYQDLAWALGYLDNAVTHLSDALESDID